MQKFTVQDFDGSPEALATLLSKGLSRIRCRNGDQGQITVYYEVDDEILEKERALPESDISIPSPSSATLMERLARARLKTEQRNLSRKTLSERRDQGRDLER